MHSQKETMNKHIKHIAVLACIAITSVTGLGLSACSKIEPAPHVQTAEEKRADTLANSKDNQELQDKLTQSRSNGLANITTNATTYVAGNPRYKPAEDWKVIPHGDDYVQNDCLSGSGWGWVNVMNPKRIDPETNDVTKVKLICSTISPDLGCYKASDFAETPHAPKAKKCDSTLPFPIKRIGG